MILIWLVFIFLKEIIVLWYQLHWALYQENLNVHSWMIFCPDGIIPDSGLTGLNNKPIICIYIYIYIYSGENKYFIPYWFSEFAAWQK